MNNASHIKYFVDLQDHQLIDLGGSSSPVAQIGQTDFDETGDGPEQREEEHGSEVAEIISHQNGHKNEEEAENNDEEGEKANINERTSLLSGDGAEYQNHQGNNGNGHLLSGNGPDGAHHNGGAGSNSSDTEGADEEGSEEGSIHRDDEGGMTHLGQNKGVTPAQQHFQTVKLEEDE